MKGKNLRSIEFKIAWDNARFIPKIANVWHRFYEPRTRKTPKTFYCSSLLYNGKVISISYFTADNNVRGWSMSVYDNSGNGKCIGGRELHTDNHIHADNINDAEIQALESVTKFNYVKY